MPTTYKCPKCGRIFYYQNALSAHMEYAHPEGGSGNFVCPVDGLKFATQADLDVHTAAAHPAGGGQQFTCPLDGQKFASQEELDAHTASAHPGTNPGGSDGSRGVTRGEYTTTGGRKYRTFDDQDQYGAAGWGLQQYDPTSKQWRTVYYQPFTGQFGGIRSFDEFVQKAGLQDYLAGGGQTDQFWDQLVAKLGEFGNANNYPYETTAPPGFEQGAQAGDKRVKQLYRTREGDYFRSVEGPSGWQLQQWNPNMAGGGQWYSLASENFGEGGSENFQDFWNKMGGKDWPLTTANDVTNFIKAFENYKLGGRAGTTPGGLGPAPPPVTPGQPTAPSSRFTPRAQATLQEYLEKRRGPLYRWQEPGSAFTDFMWTATGHRDSSGGWAGLDPYGLSLVEGAPTFGQWAIGRNPNMSAEDALAQYYQYALGQIGGIEEFYKRAYPTERYGAASPGGYLLRGQMVDPWQFFMEKERSGAAENFARSGWYTARAAGYSGQVGSGGAFVQNPITGEVYLDLSLMSPQQTAGLFDERSLNDPNSLISRWIAQGGNVSAGPEYLGGRPADNSGLPQNVLDRLNQVLSPQPPEPPTEPEPPITPTEPEPPITEVGPETPTTLYNPNTQWYDDQNPNTQDWNPNIQSGQPGQPWTGSDNQGNQFIAMPSTYQQPQQAAPQFSTMASTYQPQQQGALNQASATGGNYNMPTASTGMRTNSGQSAGIGGGLTGTAGGANGVPDLAGMLGGQSTLATAAGMGGIDQKAIPALSNLMIMKEIGSINARLDQREMVQSLLPAIMQLFGSGGNLPNLSTPTTSKLPPKPPPPGGITPPGVAIPTTGTVPGGLPGSTGWTGPAAPLPPPKPWTPPGGPPMGKPYAPGLLPTGGLPGGYVSPATPFPGPNPNWNAPPIPKPRWPMPNQRDLGGWPLIRGRR